MRYSFLPFLFLAATTLAAQEPTATFGVKAGIPTSSAGSWHEDTLRWTAGVAADLHLISHFSLEADALIRKYSFSPSSSMHQDVTAWDFPFLLKYRFRAPHMRPFLDAGYCLTHESLDESIGGGRAGNVGGRIDTGPAAGVGVEFKYRRLVIAPEARYLLLYEPDISGSNGNVLTLLVGVAF